MFEKVISTVRRLRDTVTRSISRLIAGAAIRYLAKAWRQHRERVNSNPDYAVAFGAAAAATAKLFTDDPALLAVIAALIALYLAIHHATRRYPWRSSTDPYGAADDPWDPKPDRWDDDLSPRWDDGTA